MPAALIIVKEYCRKAQLEPFFFVLQEGIGLLDTGEQDNEAYFPVAQVQDPEKYARLDSLYYNLSVNVEGIGAINQLLTRAGRTNREIAGLKNKSDFPDEI